MKIIKGLVNLLGIIFGFWIIWCLASVYFFAALLEGNTKDNNLE